MADTIPVWMESGEIVVNNDAADLLGRKTIVNANKIGAAMRNSRDMNALPRLGTGYDTGNGIQGSGSGVPGVVRRGNSYSRAVGFRQNPNYLNQQVPQFGDLPTPGYADNRLKPSAYSGQVNLGGIQRVGNSYSKIPGQLPRVYSAEPQPQAMIGYNTPMQQFQDGTQDEAGVQMPGFWEQVQGMVGAGEQPQPQAAPQPPGSDAPTLEQSRQNYQLANGLPDMRQRASGTMNPQGEQEDDDIQPGAPIPFNNPDGSMAGTASMAGVGADGPVTLAKLSPAKLQSPAAPDYSTPPQVSFQPGDGRDYGEAIDYYLGQLDQAPVSRGADAMIADKKRRSGLETALNAVSHLQGNEQHNRLGQNEMAANLMNRNADQDLKVQEMNAQGRQQEFANQAGLQSAEAAGKAASNKYALETQANLPKLHQGWMLEALQKHMASGGNMNDPKFTQMLSIYQKLFGKQQQDQSLADLMQQPAQ